MFTLQDINQMEQEMCSYFKWELTVDNTVLLNFEMIVKQDFCSPAPYPTYSLQMVSRKANITSPSPFPSSSALGDVQSNVKLVTVHIHVSSNHTQYNYNFLSVQPG